MTKSLADCSVHFIGLGLMGGSLAMALRGKVRRLTAEDRNPDVIQQALAHGVIDGTETEADIVILSIPADQILHRISTLSVLPGTLVMDLGSTKTRICEQLDQLPDPVSAVGGHPMCGLAENGFSHAIPTVYQNAQFVLCETTRTTPDSKSLAEELVRAAGAHPRWMDRVHHDHLTALTSHLPHMLSFTLMRLAMEAATEDSDLFDLAAGGFDGATRLARTDETMIVGMFNTNKDQLREMIARFRDHLDDLEAMIDDVSELRDELGTIVAARRAYTASHGERKIS
jgi:prephenate dehydrogenase